MLHSLVVRLTSLDLVFNMVGRSHALRLCTIRSGEHGMMVLLYKELLLVA